MDLAWLLVCYATALTAYLAVHTLTVTRCTVCSRGVQRRRRIDVPLRQRNGRLVKVSVCHRCWDARRSL